MREPSIFGVLSDTWIALHKAKATHSPSPKAMPLKAISEGNVDDHAAAAALDHVHGGLARA